MTSMKELGARLIRWVPAATQRVTSGRAYALLIALSRRETFMKIEIVQQQGPGRESRGPDQEAAGY
jgi:hypothetical protein